MSIINNSYVVGVNGRNLVLNTLGRLYVKVRDRYYEIDFKNLINSEKEEVKKESNLIIEDEKIDVNQYKYPGDNKIIISLDGGFYVCKDNKITEMIITTKTTNNTSTTATTPSVSVTDISNSKVIGQLYNDNLILDFSTGSIQAKSLTISDSLRYPKIVYSINGIGNKTYKGSEINVYSYDVEDEMTFGYLRTMWIKFLCDIEYLTDDSEFWIDVFLDENYDIRDFSNEDIFNEADLKIKTNIDEKFSITNYSFIYENLPIENTYFQGPIIWYETDKIGSHDVFVPGDLITNENESFEGYVVGVSKSALYVQMAQETNYKSNKIIKCNTNHRECISVLDSNKNDYRDKDFIYINSAFNNTMFIKSGTLIKCDVPSTISFIIDYNSKTLSLESNSLYMIYLQNKTIECIKLN